MGKLIEEKLKSFDETELYYREDLPDKMKAVIIIVHGLCEHLGRYDYVTQKFNAFGYGVYRFDNRGHGRSGGERGYVENFMNFIEDTDRIIELCSKENPDVPLFMLGHSMGGYISAAYGSKYKEKLKGQILLGAAVIELPIFQQLKEGRLFETSPREKSPNVLSKLICRDPMVVKEYENDPLVLKETTFKLLGEIFVNGVKWLNSNIKNYTYPCLILHGEKDEIVINEASKWMYSNIPSTDKTLKVYDKCYHEILNEKEEKDLIIGDIHNWIEDRLR
ncbi:alpha/beta hydrolase [Clostridium sp. MB40-C1]|uniref:alpha/beta hydrolase n=1 Tax=Clostridium sp. MB40-C1 TaxID=3070996 RepID=UPI0027E20C68|nr:alpha/beta hydrolase [Clostridium sp. MB40-C1]WMJ79172.1 alpha/beta hydrolase [Clostridium sp. MB40-C1]